MRFIAVVLFALALPSGAMAAMGETSMAAAKSAAAKGNAAAASAVSNTIANGSCMANCQTKNSEKACVGYCRPGRCFPAASRPYCVQ
jgi:hypothetical protein